MTSKYVEIAGDKWYLRKNGSAEAPDGYRSIDAMTIRELELTVTEEESEFDRLEPGVYQVINGYEPGELSPWSQRIIVKNSSGEWLEHGEIVTRDEALYYMRSWHEDGRLYRLGPMQVTLEK